MMFSGGARLDIRFTPADVGKRVSVRRVAEIVGGRPVFSDAVGVLTSWADGVLIITRRDGQAVHITESSVVAGKVVPDAPARRRGARPPSVSARELQEMAARGWPALENERLGEWTLRASGGFTRRANSVLPHGDPGVPLDTALRRVVDWYGERGLPAYVQVTTGDAERDARLAAELERRGWTAEGHATLRTAALAPLADAAGAERVVLSREPDPAWLAAYHRTGDLADDALKVLAGGPSVWFATVPGAAPGPAAIGRCVVDGPPGPNGPGGAPWALFGAVEVALERRRQGLATAVMAALARKALDEGAAGAYLQVEDGNEGAHALYDRMGFTTHHTYHYRRAPLGANG
ncbi:GNAT family N-acetyltransferase [Streptomyces sp. RB6PN25]|uniref:GNAT family N-acetyltransferase n=1 Tax=Streptomyces humicola TaxID=2953240 RepID=A0ABT1PRA8_9ACTN|nr:GNAT family N-acetyltransferase [Streptomyces humicola]MCQ4080199.1 GNAT family N-acetyltransferase [Streptomyces humicola]